MTVTITTKNNLASWKIQDIHRLYRAYGDMLQEYARIKKSVKLEWLNKGMNELSYAAFNFDQWFKKDVQKLDLSIAVLDREIARRGKLIGVMG